MSDRGDKQAGGDGRKAPPARRKLFTIEQANAALPLVRAIASDMAELARDLVDRKERLALLMNGRDPDSQDPYRSELAHIEGELEKDDRRLGEYIQELVALGIEPKDCLQGLVDFPSLMDGRVVYLCWRLGEPEVQFWHELEAGFSGRQPLLAGSVPGSESP
jgi:hypothetical protein